MTPGRTAPQTPSPTARAFEQYLAEKAADYFADLPAGSANVLLKREDVRAYSTLYEFEVGNGRVRHTVLVKVASGPPCPQPASAGSGAEVADRPRRALTLDPRLKSAVEYAALAMIHEEFGRLGDPRFGTVPPLDFLRPEGAIVMEKVSAPSLTAGLLKGSRLHPARAGHLQVALRNAGAWLRAYHQLDGLDHTGVRHASRERFTEYVGELTGYLARHEGRRDLFEFARARVASVAARALPAELPLGMSHGDFAPRNVLVGEGGRVTVLDTLARWRAPIYDDIADFAFAVKALKPQVYAQGTMFAPRTVAGWEDAFLGGYFGMAPRPTTALRLFEVQALLDRWASAGGASLGSRPGAGLPARLRGFAATRFLSGYLERLLREL